MDSLSAETSIGF